MHKRVCLLTMSMILLCVVATINTLPGSRHTANAEISTEVEVYEEPERYEYTSAISASLSFSGGKANCSGYVKPLGSESASIRVSLYKKNESNWTYIQSWTGSATGGATAAASGSVSVGQGTFKVVSYGNVGGKEFPTKSITKKNG